MKIDRRDLLQRLLAVEPGISKKGAVYQSDCVVMRKGRFYTLSQEIACSVISGLPVEIAGALRADKLLELLKQLPDEHIEVSAADNVLHIVAHKQNGRQRKAELPMEDEILLPVDSVELPKEWIKISEEFGEAIEMVHGCTKKRSEFLKECVHVHPQRLEASDGIKMIRYKIKTFVTASVLVRGQVMKEIPPLGMTKACETENWLHFRNPMGLRVSLKKYAQEDYPPLEEFLKLRGEKVSFPKGMVEVATRAGILADPDTGISISLDSKGALVEGRSAAGKYEEGNQIKYKGRPLKFMIFPKMISELVEKHNECEVTEATVRVEGEKFIFAAVLEAVP